MLVPVQAAVAAVAVQAVRARKILPLVSNKMSHCDAPCGYAAACLNVPTPTTQRTLVLPNMRLARYGVVVKGGRTRPLGFGHRTCSPCCKGSRPSSPSTVYTQAELVAHDDESAPCTMCPSH